MIIASFLFTYLLNTRTLSIVNIYRVIFFLLMQLALVLVQLPSLSFVNSLALAWIWVCHAYASLFDSKFSPHIMRAYFRVQLPSVFLRWRKWHCYLDSLSRCTASSVWNSQMRMLKLGGLQLEIRESLFWKFLSVLLPWRHDYKSFNIGVVLKCNWITSSYRYWIITTSSRSFYRVRG